MMFLLTALFFMLLASSMADVGPPLLHRSNDTRPARFRWTIPVENRLLYFVVDPTGKYVFCFNGDYNYTVSIQYKNRVNVNVTDTVVTFFLNEVTQADAGNFTCRDGSETAASRPDCGQYLYYLDENAVPVMPDLCKAVTRDEGQTLTLVCVVRVTALPVPAHGYSWTFASSESEAETSLDATEVSLTLGSLNRSNTGSYSCEFRDDPSYTGNTSGKSSIYLSVMGSPASTPGSPQTSATPPVGPKQDSCYCAEDFKIPFFVLLAIVIAVLGIGIFISIYRKRRGVEQPRCRRRDPSPENINPPKTPAPGDPSQPSPSTPDNTASTVQGGDDPLESKKLLSDQEGSGETSF